MSYRNRSGQAAIYLLLCLPVILALAGLVFDMGLVYAAQLTLNSSTQAATLAGAAAMAQPNATVTSVTTAVQNFSSASGGANVSSLFSGAAIATGYPVLSCLNTVENTMSVSCYGPSSTNSIVVKQTATVAPKFLRFVGARTINLSAMATAAMRSAVAAYNVAIIVDTTHSMTSTDSDPNCKSTRISCALAGVQVLLQTLSPCSPTLSTCGAATNGNVSDSYDRVGLFVFPPVTALTAGSESSCTGTVITAPYTYPTPSTSVSTYQAVGFSSDYRSSDTAKSLTAPSGSNLIAAVSTPCLQVIGGYGTYYAQAINSTQAALVAEQKNFPGSQNVMIILSDGDANATALAMPGSSTSGSYMSSTQECAQAVTQAQDAVTAGTRVYTVAYGSPSSGCSTDTSGITPCQTMSGMASGPTYFFSDYTATGGSSGCTSSSQPTTSLNQIFKLIGLDLTMSRLIPNNTQ